MYTENELEISNKSYTNKDFATIYPELLDLVKKLTNKWDPTTSNESDPGVVLLKLAALIADKNNYNIDKNVLETFPLSVTQRANARKLYDMLGYTMNWYKAADTTVSFTYTGNAFDTIENLKIKIPKWTMVTDDTTSVIYTITKEVTLSKRGVTEDAPALQGTIHDYDVNGVTDITLDNLDSQLRLFFTDRFIAENGIFITNKGNGSSTSEDYWEKVENLESAELGQKIYKFGILPNSDTCYIQFPQDIGNLIENGLNIKYLITQGVGGNIKVNTLTTFYGELIPESFVTTELEGTSINADTTILNVYSTTNGKDPEDLDSAYTNYKKTVGTFETLVTLRDYENAIYELKDSFDNPYCSNVVVSDRTCDINNTTNVVQRTTAGTELVSFLDQEVLEVKDINNNTVQLNTDAMSAFDIGLYILDAVNDTYNDYYYNKSFSVTNDFLDIKSELEDKKCIKHDYIDTAPGDGRTYLYKAFYKLVGKVITHYKVTSVQATEIEDKIRKALYERYNARNVNFGEPVNYDDLVKTILNADTRIKSVILAEPEYFLRRMLDTDTTGVFRAAESFFAKRRGTSDDESISILTEFLAKMILAGNVQLYNFNQDVSFKFGQTNITKYQDISKLTSESLIDKESVINTEPDVNGNVGYKIQTNENIQLFAPNLYTKTSYTSYVNYQLTDSDLTSESDELTISTDSSQSITVKDKSYEVTIENNILKVNGTECSEISTGKYKCIVDYITFEFSISESSGTYSGIYTYTPEFVIPQNTYYRLSSSLTITVNYTDSNKNALFKTYGEGTIVKFSDSSDDEAVLCKTASTITKTRGGVNIEFSTLTASQQLDILDINRVTFDDQTVPCLWFTNNKTTITDGLQTKTSYVLFSGLETQKILEDNEYFIYTNQDRNELVILGSGTMIERVSTSSTLGTVSYETTVVASSILSEGLNALTENDWYPFVATKDNKLLITELLIVTLGKDAGFKAKKLTDDAGSDVLYITNTPVRVSEGAYCEDYDKQEWIKLVDYDIANDTTSGEYIGWKVRSKLNLVVGNNYSLKLTGDNKITITLSKEELFESGTVSWVQGSDVWSVSLTLDEPEEEQTTLIYNCVFNGQDCAFIIDKANKNAGIIDGSFYYQYQDDTHRGEAYTVEGGRFTYAGKDRFISLDTSTQVVSGEITTFDVSLTNTSLLSSLLIGSAGGTDMEVSSTDKDETVDFYAYTEAELPSYTYNGITNTLKYQDNNEIQVTYQFFREYVESSISNTGGIKLPFSYKGRVYDYNESSKESSVTDENIHILVPVILQASSTKNVVISGGESDVTLTTDDPVGYVEFKQTSSEEFDGITVKSWEVNTDLMPSYELGSSDGSVKIAGTNYNYKLSIANGTVQLTPENTTKHNTYSLDSYFILGTDWLKFEKITINNIDVYRIVTLTMTDFIEVGNIYITEGNNKYSAQVTKTAEILARNYETTETVIIEDILKYIKQDNNKYNFDFAYIVPEEDMIDTETTNDDNKDYLFSSTAVFDSNHIMNKYIIPLLITTNETSIKVAAQSISK